MPNEEFAAEVLRAAGDLYSLYFPGEVPKSSPDCDYPVDKLGAEGDTN